MAANITLDLMIERIGQDKFSRTLQIHLDLEKQVAEACANRTHLRCSSSGTWQSSWPVEIATSKILGVDTRASMNCLKK